jgi:hypothetical protein
MGLQRGVLEGPREKGLEFVSRHHVIIEGFRRIKWVSSWVTANLLPGCQSTADWSKPLQLHRLLTLVVYSWTRFTNCFVFWFETGYGKMEARTCQIISQMNRLSKQKIAQGRRQLLKLPLVYNGNPGSCMFVLK